MKQPLRASWAEDWTCRGLRRHYARRSGTGRFVKRRLTRRQRHADNQDVSLLRAFAGRIPEGIRLTSVTLSLADNQDSEAQS